MDFCLFPITKNINDCLTLESEQYCDMRLQKSPEPCKDVFGGEVLKQDCMAWGNLDNNYFENEFYVQQSCESWTGELINWGLII